MNRHAFLGLAAALFIASGAHAGEWVMYDQRNGLPPQPVHEIAFDTDGTVYAKFIDGTVERFARDRWQFFGSSFSISAWNIYPGVTTLAPGPDGSMWSADQDKLFVVWQLMGNPAFSSFDGFLHYSDCAARGDTLWIAAKDRFGFFTASSRSFHSVAFPESALLANDVAVDRAGAVWVATSRGSCPDPYVFTCDETIDGLLLLRGDRWERVTPAEGLPSADVGRILASADGTVWTYHPDLGCFGRYANLRWTRVDLPRAANGATLAPDLFDTGPDGGLWCIAHESLSGPQHLVHFARGEWTILPDSELPPNSPRSLAVDEQGHLWVGTDVGSVGMLQPTYARLLPSALTPFPDLEDAAHRLWRVDADSLRRFDGSAWTTHPPGGGLPAPRRLFLRGDGTPLALTAFGVFAWSDSSGWISLGLPGALADGGTTAFAEAPDGSDRFLTVGGSLLRRDPAGWTRIDTTGAHLGGATDRGRLLVDHTGRLWVFGLGSLSMLDASGWTRFTPSDETIGYGREDRVFETATGDIWLATTTKVPQLLRFESGAWVPRYTGYLLDEKRDFAGRTWALATDEFGESEHLLRFDQGPVRVDDFYAFLGAPTNLAIDPDLGPIVSGTVDNQRIFVGRRDGSEFGWTVQVLAPTLESAGIPTALWRPEFRESTGRLWLSGRSNDIAGIPYRALFQVDEFPPQTEFIVRPPRLLGSSRTSAIAAVSRCDPGEGRFAFTIDDSVPPPHDAFGTSDTWTSDDLPDGIHVLRCWSRDGSQRADPTPVRATLEVDTRVPVPHLAAPVEGAVVTDTLRIVGTFTGRRIASARLLIVSSPRNAVVRADTIAVARVPSNADSLLAVVSTAGLRDGDYALRYEVADSLGHLGAAASSFRVDNVPPRAAETVPVHDLRAETGGDAWTNGGEVHVSFPPHAFAHDTDVDIALLSDSAAVAEAPSLAGRVLLAFRLEWSPSPLLKDAGVSARPPTLAGDARFVRLDGSLVGGNVDPGDASRWLASVRDAGSYALVWGPPTPADSTNLPTAFRLLGISPRVLRTGGSASRLSFALPSGGSVDALVYNRAGRRVRTIASRAAYPAGQHVLVWDGRDDRGAQVPEGIYLVSVESSGRKEVATIAVIGH